MRGFCMIPHSGKHWRVWSSWSERSQINIGPSKCPARAIHSAFRKTLRTWRWMWSGILKVKLILSAQLPASPTTDILLPKQIIHLWSWKTCYDIHSCWMGIDVSDRRRRRRRRRSLQINCLVFRFQTFQLLSVPSCLRVLRWFHMVLLIPLHKDWYQTFSAKGKDPGDPIIFGFQSNPPIIQCLDLSIVCQKLRDLHSSHEFTSR